MSPLFWYQFFFNLVSNFNARYTLLPIYRLSAEDPDDENTLATAIFTLSATRVAWQVFTLDRENAVLQGSL